MENRTVIKGICLGAAVVISFVGLSGLMGGLLGGGNAGSILGSLLGGGESQQSNNAGLLSGLLSLLK